MISDGVSLTEQEEKFWHDCEAIIDNPKDECEEFVMSGECRQTWTMAKCFEVNAEKQQEESNGEKIEDWAYTLEVVANICDWNMETSVYNYMPVVQSGASNLLITATALLVAMTTF